MAPPDDLVQQSLPQTLPAVLTAGKCNAKKRRNKGRCGNLAGYRTLHAGYGPCYLHGGRGMDASTTHGINSRYLHEQLAPLIAQYQADPDPLNIYPELAALRALLQRYLLVHPEISDASVGGVTASQALATYLATCPELLSEHPALSEIAALGDVPPVSTDTIDGCGRIIDRITKTVAQIEKIRADNAISRADLVRLLRYQLQVVEQVVAQRLPVSVEVQGRIVDDVKTRWGKFQYGLAAAKTA